MSRYPSYLNQARYGQMVADALSAAGQSALAVAQSQVTGLVAALAAKEATANKGVAGGYASLDGSTLVPTAQVPGYVKNNYTATVAPTVNSDSSQGYSAGSRWINTITGNEWSCIDATIGAAVWRSHIRVLSQSGNPITAPSDTNENTLASITIPAGALAANGRLKITTYWETTNNANAKTNRIRLGGISGAAFLNYSAASFLTQKLQIDILAANSTSSQVGGIFATGGFGGGPYAPVTSSLDMTTAQTLLITAQKSNGADTTILVGYTVELINP